MKNNLNKTERVVFNATPEQKELIAVNAKTIGMPMSVFVLNCVLDKIAKEERRCENV